MVYLNTCMCGRLVKDANLSRVPCLVIHHTALHARRPQLAYKHEEPAKRHWEIQIQASLNICVVGDLPLLAGHFLTHNCFSLSLSLICIGGQLFPAARKLASTLLNILYIHTLCVFFDKQHQSKVLRSIASADRRLYMGPHNKLYTHTHYVRFKNIVILVLVKEINTYDPR